MSVQFKVYAGAGGRRFVGVVGQGEFVAECSKQSGAVVNSNRRDQAAAGLLHSIGLHSQQEVINLHARGVPGYGPANPINRSSHCGFNDGVAIPWKAAGAKLTPWESGVDLSDPPAFCDQAKRMGESFDRSYPSAVGEGQHCNSNTAQARAWRAGPPALRHGDNGREVRRIVRKLQYCTRPAPHAGQTYLPYPKLGRPLSEFGGWVDTAVVDFQRDFGLPVDGIVGERTRAMLDRRVRWQRRHGGQGKHRPALRPRKRPAPKVPPKPSTLHKGPVNGGDFSEHNGSVDWRKFAIGNNEFASIRCSDGDHRDPTYTRARVNELRKDRILFFPYHYARVASAKNGQRSGSAECKMALGFAKAGGWDPDRDLPFAYDFEDLNGQSVEKAARHLMQFAAYYVASEHRKFALYTMPGFWSAIVGHLSRAELAFLRKWTLTWVAHWRVKRPAQLRGLNPWTFWQYNDRGVYAGVSGGADHNLFRGSYAQLLALTH